MVVKKLDAIESLGCGALMAVTSVLRGVNFAFAAKAAFTVTVAIGRLV